MEKNNRLFLDRKVFDDIQTRGKLYVVNNEELKEQYRCLTLELPYVENQYQISSIPRGVFRCKKRYSEKYGEHIHILNVPDRDMILIHIGNFHHETKGCVLVGDSYEDINGDGHLDLLNSRKTLEKLLSYLDDEFVIVVL